MPAAWLYQIGPDGMLVTPDIMTRVRNGDAAALRALNRQPLTKLYRVNYTRPRRNDAIGLFWADVPPLDLIPVIRGRNAPPAWVKDDLVCETHPPRKNEYCSPKVLQRAKRSAISYATLVGRRMKREEQTLLLKVNGNSVKAWKMKPNPKFDLVVVNRHDRAALLKLLGEVDGAASVPRWLAARTTRGGATAPSALHADYVAWCERESEAAAGMKGFTQAMVAAGVTKLTRSAGSVRYELQLR